MNAEFLIKLLCDVICYIFNEQTNIYREMGAGPAIVSQASARKSSVTSSSMCYIFFFVLFIVGQGERETLLLHTRTFLRIAERHSSGLSTITD